MNKYYKEFLITAEPFITDIITSVLWNLDINGINEEVNCLKIFSKNLNLSQTDIENELNKLIENNLLRSYDVQENVLIERNWNEEWENSREVIRVSDRIVIRPSFKEYNAKENEKVIILDPKMSFGTGEHPTTKICIQLIEKYLIKGHKVLDAGCGTAILSIVAAKLGADKVIGFDIDEWSFENAIENIKINDAEKIVEVRKCSIENIEEKNFDLIVANIQKNVLIQIAPFIKLRIKPEGILILSGLIEIDIDEIRATYSSLKFSEINLLQIDEWFGLVLRNNL